MNPTKNPCLSVHSPLTLTDSQVFQKILADNKKHKTHKNQVNMKSVLNAKTHSSTNNQWLISIKIFGFQESKQKYHRYQLRRFTSFRLASALYCYLQGLGSPGAWRFGGGFTE